MPRKSMISESVARILVPYFIKEMNDTHALGLQFRATLSEFEFSEVGQLLGEVICAIGDKGLSPLLASYPELAPET